jgi:hypothetical protein
MWLSYTKANQKEWKIKNQELIGAYSIDYLLGGSFFHKSLHFHRFGIVHLFFNA